VAHAGLRLKEAAKLGFQRALVPPSVQDTGGMELKQFRTLANLVDHILGRD
jgi:DNA repair protein RadA/Sms